MLNFAFWPALWLGLALAPVVFFYFLRMRFRRQPLGATYLWRRLVRQESGGHALHWKSILLLILQILAVLCLVLAAAGPSLVSVVQDKPGVIFLVDDSASMASTDGSQRLSRFARATRLLGEELQALPPRTSVVVMLCAGSARPLDSRDKQPRIWEAADAAAIQALLAATGPGDDAFREDAVAEGLRVWQSGQAGGWQAVLIGDGGCDLSGSRLHALFGDQLRFLPVGESATDIGLLSAHPDAAHPDILRLSLGNSGSQAQTAWVRLSRDGQELSRFELNAAAGQSWQDLRLDAPLGPGGYSLELMAAARGAEPWRDDLSRDDRLALAINLPPPIGILHLGKPNPFLQAAFAGPAYRFVTIEFPPSEFAAGEWDLVVNELDTLPAGFDANLLSFGTLPPDAPVAYGQAAAGQLTDSGAAHPLNRFVDWQDSRVAAGQGLVAGPGAQVLASAGGQPMLVAWERLGYRQVAFGCALFASDLALSGGFPVFLRNLIQWCVPQYDNPLADNLRVGEPSLRSVASDWQLGGDGFGLVRQPGGLVRLHPLRPGLAAWTQAGDAGWLAVRLPESETALAPRALPGIALRPADGQTAVTGPAGAPLARRNEIPLAWLALVVALALLALEWVLWQGIKARRR